MPKCKEYYLVQRKQDGGTFPSGEKTLWIRVKETEEGQEAYVIDPNARAKRQMEVLNRLREQLRGHRISETIGDVVVTTEGRSGAFVLRVRGREPYRFTRLLYGVTEWSKAVVAHQEAVAMIRLKTQTRESRVEIRR